jgi:acetylornithine/succinyldiaminopimelate/putrescine aminotransferase
LLARGDGRAGVPGVEAHQLQSGVLQRADDATRGQARGAQRLGQGFFANSGAEANEGAIKLARKWGAARRRGAAGIMTAVGCAVVDAIAKVA